MSPSAQVDLADQRVREQRLEHPVAPAAQGGVEGQVLVRGDVAAISPAYSGSSGATGSGVAPAGSDLRRAPRSRRRRAGTAACRRCATLTTCIAAGRRPLPSSDDASATAASE